jgi:hypothetical protein
VEEVENKYIGSIHIIHDGLKLYARAKHVFEEAGRVYAFKDSTLDSSRFMQRAGKGELERCVCVSYISRCSDECIS